MVTGSKLLSTGQAARLLSVTPDTVLKWIKQGRVPAAQTAGGHYRIAREHVEGLLHEHAEARAPRPDSALMYCWEYYAEDGQVNSRCHECVVYRARALNCYEMSSLPPEAGFAGTYCQTSCEECPYYQELVHRPRRVLVVTDSLSLRDRLWRERRSTRFEIEFATCEYECSAVLGTFRPEYVVIDCSLPRDMWRDLCSHLADDPRVPGVQIILAQTDEIDLSGDHGAALERLPGSFSLVELERHIVGASRRREEARKIPARQ